MRKLSTIFKLLLLILFCIQICVTNLHAENVPSYFLPDISGQTFPCANTTETYSTPAHAGSTYLWNLSGGGNIIAQNGPLITIQWTSPAGSGPWVLGVQETDSGSTITNASVNINIRGIVMVCNDVVQVSLGNQCTAKIYPDMVLEGPYTSYAGMVVTLTPTSAGAFELSDTIIGKGHYNYMVTEPCSGNSCWGKIIAEDKLAPVINCQPVSFPCIYQDTAVVLPNLSQMPTYAIPGGGIGGVVINDNCGITQITYTDQIEDINCTDLFGVVSAILHRHWHAWDMSGNVGSCVQDISFIRQPITNVVFPADVTIDCSDGNMAPDHTGVPHVAGLPIYPGAHGAGFCEINAGFQDEIISVCGATRKVLRTWTIVDWCQPLNQTNPNIPMNPRTTVQVIMVMDQTGPVFTCPANLTVSTGVNCNAPSQLPDVLLTDACSSIASVRAITPVGTFEAYLGTYPGNNIWIPDTLAHFPQTINLYEGTHLITYVAYDVCGNSSSCSFYMTVGDFSPPIPICIAFTKISLGADGSAMALPTVFDNGSYDHCGPVHFKVRRMDGSPCEANNTNFFNDKVFFCCTDIGDSIMVNLRVYDQQVEPGLVDEAYLQGHYNNCMARVIVEDKLKPTCQAPANVTVNCESLDPSFWPYGSPIIHDNCSVPTVQTSFDYSNYDQTCNRGTVRRIFTVTDASGYFSQCTQQITVLYRTDYAVKFPDDVTLHQCSGSGNYGEPVFFGKDCELPGVSYTDQVFTVVPDACYKIVRTWKVIDWCNFNPNFTPTYVQNPNNSDFGPTAYSNENNHGYFQYVQLIKVQDDQAPVINNCPSGPLTFLDYTDNDPNLYNGTNYWDNVHQTHNLCEGPAVLGITATDACSGTNIDVSYTIYLDYDQNGNYDYLMVSGQPNSALLTSAINGNNLTVSINSAFQFPYGTHKIAWVVKDGCGNISTCTYNFTIADGKKPSLTCLNGLSVNIMQTKTISLWASDFLQYAVDNCTPSDQLVLGIRKSGTGTGFPIDANVIFNCDELGTQTVEVWARDKAGNSDFCETYVIVQDNMDNCNNTIASVSGSLLTEEVEGVQETFVKIAGANNALPVPGMFTPANGHYDFNALPVGDDYTITPEKDVNWLNGVSTFDLLLITKHITNNQPLNSPYKIIAADANHNGTVTTYDILQLRKLVLGLIDVVPDNTSWRFVPSNFAFPNPTNPFQTPFPESITIADMTANMGNGDFMGIKVGDVNNSALPNQLVAADDRTKQGNLCFDLQEKAFKTGEEMSVAVTCAELARVLGYQFTLAFDPDYLECLDVLPGSLPSLNTENFGTSHIKAGLITCSWNGDANAPQSVVVLRFRAKKDGLLSQNLHLSNQITATEAYERNGENWDIQLRYLDAQGNIAPQGVGFELYQNQPNPFTSHTNIGFNLPAAGKATLTIMDATGKTLLVQQGDYPKGQNSISLDKSALPSTGVFVYRLETVFGSEQKKMVVMTNN